MKTLWIRFGAFGDVLQATARARLFKRKFPDAALTLLTRPEYKRVMSAQDCYDDIILWDSKRDPLGFFRTVREIRQKKFDMLVSVHNAGAAAVVSFFSRIPARYGYNKTLQFCYQKDVWEWFREVGIDYDLRDEPFIQATDETLHLADALLANLPEKKIFCIIGASKPQKVWSIDYWIEFLRPLVREGWGVVINGHGDIEAQDAARIKSELGGDENILDLANRLDYLEMAAVVKKCTIAVGPDTGPLHLAALVGTPTLGLFGCTSSQKMGFTMPWFREQLCKCPNVGCWNYKCTEGENCMKTLIPEMVLSEFRR